MINKHTNTFWGVAGLVFFGLVYLLSPILTPFLIAAILAYIANPLVNKIDAFHYKKFSPSRTVATLLVMLLFF
ncbi:MAG: AI-2E family transporter, partial [Methylotenera sp.]|nr:AI-2E family transporter [Methylotenera sp.]